MSKEHNSNLQDPRERERKLIEEALRQVSDQQDKQSPPVDPNEDATSPLSSIGEDMAIAQVGASLFDSLEQEIDADASAAIDVDLSRYEIIGPLGKGGMGE